MENEPVLAWHWTNGPILRDGRPVSAGDVVTHDGPVEICTTGLHASERIIDALQYAPGSYIWRVECRDIVRRQDDKLVCRHRTHVWGYEADPVLRALVRACALDVIHLWDAPPIVRQYLETGDESIRDAARDAAWAAAGAAGDAAWAAGYAAEFGAGATRDAAWAARDAAWDAARDKQNDRLTRMIEEARPSVRQNHP
jgi:hypothetical protein